MNLQQQKKLEALLIQSKQQPAHFVEFLQQLMQSQVYCPIMMGDGSAADSQASQVISFQRWTDAQQQQSAVFFTSVEKMRQVLPIDQAYLCFPAKKLFEMNATAHLRMNPETDISQDFYSPDIQSVLQGNYSTVFPDDFERVIEVFLGQPSEYPNAMVEQLNDFFVSESNIVAAYLAEILDQSRDTQPSLLIGLHLATSLDEIQKQQLHGKIGRIAYASIQHKKTIDLVHLEHDEQDGIEQYLLHETKPFYVRQQAPYEENFVRLFS